MIKKDRQVAVKLITLHYNIVILDQHLATNTVKLNFRILIEKDNCEPEYRALACTGKWYSLRDKGEQMHGQYSSPRKIQALSPNFLVRKFSVIEHYLQIFRRIARKLGRKTCILRGDFPYKGTLSILVSN